jgi:hypothetical protein
MRGIFLLDPLDGFSRNFVFEYDTLRKCNTYCCSTAIIVTLTHFNAKLYLHCICFNFTWYYIGPYSVSGISGSEKILLL